MNNIDNYITKARKGDSLRQGPYQRKNMNSASSTPDSSKNFTRFGPTYPYPVYENAATPRFRNPEQNFNQNSLSGGSYLGIRAENRFTETYNNALGGEFETEMDQLLEVQQTRAAMFSKPMETGMNNDKFGFANHQMYSESSTGRQLNPLLHKSSHTAATSTPKFGGYDSDSNQQPLLYGRNLVIPEGEGPVEVQTPGSFHGTNYIGNRFSNEPDGLSFPRKISGPNYIQNMSGSTTSQNNLIANARSPGEMMQDIDLSDARSNATQLQHQTRSQANKVADNNTQSQTQPTQDMNFKSAATRQNSPSNKPERKMNPYCSRVLAASIQNLLMLTKKYSELIEQKTLFEVYGFVLNIRSGQIRNENIILIRDQGGPVLQISLFDVDGVEIKSIVSGCLVRAVGSMVGHNRIRAFHLRLALPHETDAVNRLYAVGQFTVKKILDKEFSKSGKGG